jgi:hypothetical protein
MRSASIFSGSAAKLKNVDGLGAEGVNTTGLDDCCGCVNEKDWPVAALLKGNGEADGDDDGDTGDVALPPDAAAGGDAGPFLFAKMNGWRDGSWGDFFEAFVTGIGFVSDPANGSGMAPNVGVGAAVCEGEDENKACGDLVAAGAVSNGFPMGPEKGDKAGMGVVGDGAEADDVTRA